MEKPVTLRAMLRALCAAHLASYVQGGPSKDRGGLMLVAPPEAFKSTMLGILRRYNDVVLLSDANVTSLVELREAIAGQGIRSLAFPEWPKLYERDPRSAANVEGHIRVLTGEAFQGASFEPVVARLEARCTIFGAMTTTCRDEHFQRWQDSGFYRRFLWSLYSLKNPRRLARAVADWEPVDLGRRTLLPENHDGRDIPNLTTRRERIYMERWLSRLGQGFKGNTLQHTLLCRMLAVLKWWDRETGNTTRDAWRTMKLFALTLGEHGAQLALPLDQQRRRT